DQRCSAWSRPVTRSDSAAVQRTHVPDADFGGLRIGFSVRTLRPKLDLDERSHLRPEVALVLAGDGSGRAAARAQARALGLVENETIYFPGAIPAEDAPGLLACGEIHLAPTKRNPDGSPFFGSPTKIFEYMAMGRTIIASGLDQIGEILDDSTALLVEPGDVRALFEALRRAFEDPRSCASLGASARRAAAAGHSWSSRMSALAERLSSLGLYQTNVR
ncbi:MAG: glycosyltransferase, partial [Parvularculaceae bacterium]